MGSRQQIHVLVYCPVNALDKVSMMMHSKSISITANTHVSVSKLHSKQLNSSLMMQLCEKSDNSVCMVV
jgi:hypothetical protein